jgi:hypothetical protein
MPSDDGFSCETFGKGKKPQKKMQTWEYSPGQFA